MKIEARRASVLLAVLCLGFLPYAEAQAVAPAQAAAKVEPALPPELKLTKAPPTYAGEPLVVEKLKTTYHFQADGTGEKTIYLRARIQSEGAARQSGVLSIAYAADNESVEMRSLQVRKADGTIVQTPATDAQDQPTEVTRLAPFYSDLRQKQYPVRSLSVGDTLEYEAVIHVTKAQAFTTPTQGAPAEAEFWGGHTLTTAAVVLDEEVALRVPSARTITVMSPKHKPVLTTEGDDRVYRWTSTQLKPLVLPAGEPKDAKADDTPDDAATGLPDIAWSSFHDWAEVGRWYSALASDRATPTPELKTKAAGLVTGATTDEEKVRRIYAYVSGNVRYIGVAFGVGRYQPHAAAEVLANQYGDCKDKHTLLAGLLAAAGIEASPVLIGAGVKFDRDVPAPSSFNHVITAVQLGDKRIWLDSTAEVAPFGVLSAAIRDKDALLMPAHGEPVLVKTPAALPFAAFDHWEARGTLDADGKLTGHFDVIMRGDLELAVRWSLRQATAAQWPEMAQNISNNFGFSGKVSNFIPTSPDQTDPPLHYSYDYQRDTYGDWPNHKILSLVPYGLFATAQLDKKPSEAITTGSPRLESARSVIHLPEGYTANLPNAVHVKSSFASYDVTYSAKDGDVICEAKLEVRTSSLPPAQWEEYNNFAKGIQDNSEIFVQLRLPGQPAETVVAGKAADPGATPAASGASTVNDVNAAALLDEAWKLLQAQDLPGAEGKVEAARKLNPDQWSAWAMAGILAAAHGHSEEAEQDYQKELALHPENEFALRSLVAVQVFLKERPQAIETMRKVVKLEPDDVQATQQLAGLLTAEKRYPEALTLLQSAAFKNPGNKQLILQLGTTQLAAGRTEEAVATLHTALEDATDPLVLNNAAYELAMHNADLPLAEKSARKALAALDTETQKFTLANVTQKELGHTTLLANTWDTLGWIEFQQGDAHAAEPLLAAAWASSQHAEVGYHLGKVYEKLGKPKQAYEAYRGARAAMGKGQSFSGSDEIESRVAALEKSGITAPPFDRNDLGGGRIYTLPQLTKKKTEGDYFLLLSPGKVEAASWIKGDEELKPLEPRLAASLQSALTAAEKPSLFPQGSGAKQVRRGVLSCSPISHNCMIVIMLPQDARLDAKPMTLDVKDDRANASK